MATVKGFTLHLFAFNFQRLPASRNYIVFNLVENTILEMKWELGV
jgi:hypothetical protein